MMDEQPLNPPEPFPDELGGPPGLPSGCESDHAEEGGRTHKRRGYPGPPHPEPYPFWTYGDVFLFVGLAVPCMLLAWAMVKGALAILRVHSTAAAVEPVAEQFALYLMLFGALTLIFRVQYDRPFWRSLAWTRLRLPFLWVVIFGVAAAYLVAILGQLIHTPTTKNTMTELMEDRGSLLLMTVYGVTLGPLCEELAFRGFLQPLLARSMGAVLGIVLTTLPFGLLHYWEYGKSWRHAVMVAVAGAAFGWMRHATGSTKASTLMHASYNGLFFVATLAQRKDLIR